MATIHEKVIPLLSPWTGKRRSENENQIYEILINKYVLCTNTI